MDRSSRHRGYVRDSSEEARRLREVEREAERGAAGGSRLCVHVHHHHHHHPPGQTNRVVSSPSYPRPYRRFPSPDNWRGGSPPRSGVSPYVPRQPRAARRDSSSSLDSAFRNPRRASRNSPPGRPSPPPNSLPPYPPPPYDSLGFPACNQAVDGPELGDLVVKSSVLSPNFLPPSRRAPEDILEEGGHIFEEVPPTDVDFLSEDLPAESESGESFRSDSSRLPEQVNAAREDLCLLIRSEIYDIIADGYRSNHDIFDQLISRFLDETCDNLLEFRALFHFAFRSPMGESFARVCEEARR